MKNFIFGLGATLLIFSACSQNKKVETDSTEPNKECYQAIIEGDTSTLSFAKQEPRMVGDLEFNFAEKEDTKGTISGEFYGDTLFVEYAYELNGTKYSNPQVFLRKGNQMIQGYGKMRTTLGRTYFENHSEIAFADGFVYDPIDCK